METNESDNLIRKYNINDQMKQEDRLFFGIA